MHGTHRNIDKYTSQSNQEFEKQMHASGSSLIVLINTQYQTQSNHRRHR